MRPCRWTASAPVGTYRVRVFQPGKSDFAGAFEVQSYQLEPIDLSFDLKKTVFYRGETIEADVVARYQYGAPVANRPIEVTLPDQRVAQRGTTDADGQVPRQLLRPRGSPRSRRLRLVARLPQDNVTAAAAVMLAIRGFNIGIQTNRDRLSRRRVVPAPGLDDRRPGRADRPVALGGGRQDGEPGGPGHRARGRAEDGARPTPRRGRGRVTFRIDDPQGGHYVLRVAGTDRFGNPIVADRADLRLGQAGRDEAADPGRPPALQGRRGGQRQPPQPRSRGTALLTWEADRILAYRLVTLKDGDNPVGWAVDGPQFPNFTLTAARMWENKFDQAKLDIQVERDLRVTVAPVKPIVGPGEAGRAGDHHGRPARPARRRPSSRSPWSTSRCSRLYADRHARRSAASSTTRLAPARSRPRPPTRSVMRPRPCPWPRRSSTRPSGPRPWRPTRADRAGIQEQAQRPGPRLR